ncbi:MAG: hypothetical protein NC412_01785 [Roseburia sp.]|nr:hypothetical protein [Roseburia sp.]MCM1277988.1 hypothetical protein [Robinsoniella sp.]
MRKDIITTGYFQDNERFADFFNGYVFRGKKIIQPEHLVEQEIRGVMGRNVISGKDGRKYLYRDILKKSCQGMDYLLLGIENQSDIHYAMPIRNMIYDAIAYDEQLTSIRKKHRQVQDLEGAEKLSGFSRHDRLTPIISAVIYYGKQPWDGPKDLFGMLQMSAIPKEALKYINNNKTTIFEVRRDKVDCFQTEIRQCFQFLQYESDRKALRQLLEKDKAYQRLSEDAFEMLSVLSGERNLIINKEQYGSKREGGYDMCKAFEDERLEGKREGKKEGIKIGENRAIKKMACGMRSLGISIDLILQAIMESYHLSRTEAERYLN